MAGGVHVVKTRCGGETRRAPGPRPEARAPHARCWVQECREAPRYFVLGALSVTVFVTVRDDPPVGVNVTFTVTFSRLLFALLSARLPVALTFSLSL